MKERRAAIIYIEDEKGRVLCGKRNDTGLYVTPGGHIENGEEPAEGAKRELLEETGLTAKECTLKAVKYIKEKNILLYLFHCVPENLKMDTSKDPDLECKKWEFKYLVDIVHELQVPIEHNIVVSYYLAK